MTVVVRHRCASPAAAERLKQAVAADNPEFLRLDVEGAELVVRVLPAAPSSVRATLDDLLGCLKAAERADAAPPTS